MKAVVQQIIDQYYLQKNVSDYLDKCRNKNCVPVEIKNYAKQHDITICDINEEEIWPSVTVDFTYPSYIRGELEVQYSSTLKISKLAPVFYVEHAFQVENKDPNRINPTLEGFDSQPYTKQQLKLESQVKNVFQERGFQQLSYSEMNEVISDLQFPEDVTLFGPQVTVEYALFFDLLELCPD